MDLGVGQDLVELAGEGLSLGVGEGQPREARHVIDGLDGRSSHGG